MQLVLLVQSGDDGPVKIAGATDRNLERVVNRLQLGNPEQLHVRKALDGDERLEKMLTESFAGHRLPRGWYAPTVLDLVPGDVAHYEGFDDFDERRRIAAAALADPAEWT